MTLRCGDFGGNRYHFCSDGCKDIFDNEPEVLSDGRIPDGRGFGHALLKCIAQLAVERGCGRVEWWVLDWNRDAIGFYKKIGAEPMEDWTVFRLSGDMLLKIAAQEPQNAAFDSCIHILEIELQR